MNDHANPAVFLDEAWRRLDLFRALRSDSGCVDSGGTAHDSREETRSGHAGVWTPLCW